jgi:PIN domain nuclease of toxin-antitoxin system
MILLDTHIVLAVLGQTDIVLKSDMQKVLRLQQRSFVSVATIWEITIKNRIGKLALSVDIKELENILQGIDIPVLPISSEHATSEIGPEPTTKDRFDRLLLGVCAVEGLKLLTIDRELMAHPLVWR